MDRLTSMQVFLKVADEGGFSAAAQRLAISKSAASKHIQQLEAQLGVRLLDRNTRQLSLTEAGTRYHEHCIRILEAVAEADRSVSSLQSQPRGRLRISAPYSFGLLHLKQVLPAFLAQYPELSIEVTLNDRLVDLVNEGFDIAIRITELRDSSLVARRIAPAQSWLCASPGYLAQRGLPQNPAALAEHDCLVYTYGRHIHEWHLHDQHGHQHRIAVRGRLQVNNGEFLLAAAERDRGIVLMPDFIVADAVRAGRLVRLLPGYTGAPHAIYALYPGSRHVSAKVRAFVDFLIEQFGSEVGSARCAPGTHAIR